MALDTFNPYLFVSAGEQSNKFLTPAYADGIAQFQAQRAQSLTGLTVRIDPIQEGTGDPSPENIRPISGRTGLTVTAAGKNLANFVDGKGIDVNGYVSDYTGRSATVDPIFVCNGVSYKFASVNNTVKCIYSVFNGNTLVRRVASVTSGSTLDTSGGDKLYVCGYSFVDITAASDELMVVADTIPTVYEPYAGHTYPISWQTQAGTIYGGTLDVVSSVLTVDWDYIASYNGETLPGEWISDRDVYAEGTTPTTGAEVAYKLAEPVTYQLDPEKVMTVPGFNQIYSDAGPIIDIKF